VAAGALAHKGGLPDGERRAPEFAACQHSIRIGAQQCVAAATLLHVEHQRYGGDGENRDRKHGADRSTSPAAGALDGHHPRMMSKSGLQCNNRNVMTNERFGAPWTRRTSPCHPVVNGNQHWGGSVTIGGWDVAAVLLKAITYAATLAAAGGIFFLSYCRGLLLEGERQRIRRLIGRLALAAGLVSCVRIALLSASMSGDFSGMFDASMVSLLLSGGEGRATGLRLVGLLLVIVAVVTGRGLVLASIGAVVAAVSFAAVGHTHAVASSALPELMLSVHPLSITIWLGALRPLLLIAGEAGVARTAAIAARFGTAALCVVGLLVIAGAIVLVVLLDGVAQLWTSRYGRWVSIKLGFVVALLSLAAFNKLRLTPRLRTGDSSAILMFRHSIEAEMLLAGSILVITAAFTTITGPGLEE